MTCQCDTQKLLADLANERVREQHRWQIEREEYRREAVELRKDIQKLKADKLESDRIAQKHESAQQVALSRVQELERQREYVRNFFGVHDHGGDWS